MTPELRRDAAAAVQVISAENRQLSAGRAVLFVLEQIGWRPSLVRLGKRRPFLWAVELGYWIVANHRPFFDRFLFRSVDPAELDR